MEVVVLAHNTNSETADEFTNHHDKDRIGSAEDHYIIMESDDGKIGLFRVLSDEAALDVNILPKLVRPTESFDTVADAIQFVNQRDR